MTSSHVTEVTCNVTVNASNIHKTLESLEVQPVVVAANSDCLSVWSVSESGTGSTTPRQFVVDVNFTSSNETVSSCDAVNLTFNATILDGKFVSSIDHQLPSFRHTISPHLYPGTNRTTLFAYLNPFTADLV